MNAYFLPAVLSQSEWYPLVDTIYSHFLLDVAYDQKLLYSMASEPCADIYMNKNVKHKKLKASVKPLKAVPKVPSSKWTSALES
jgi:hypothetical protein